MSLKSTLNSWLTISPFLTPLTGRFCAGLVVAKVKAAPGPVCAKSVTALSKRKRCDETTHSSVGLIQRPLPTRPVPASPASASQRDGANNYLSPTFSYTAMTKTSSDQCLGAGFPFSKQILVRSS